MGANRPADLSVPIDECRFKSLFGTLAAHAKFYPIRPNKAPAVKSLDRDASTDANQIKHWRRQHAGIAARIQPGARLFVLDLESAHKHAGKLGPDGMMSLCSILEEHDLKLPEAPTTLTCTGGWHIYMLAPEGMTVESCIGVWAGIDVLAADSNVILPGSQVHAGLYTTARGFDECEIPEAPREFVELLQRAAKSKPRKHAPVIEMPLAGAPVSKRQWFLLWRSKYFRTMWNRRKLFGDQSDSAYEFHLAKACFSNGLDSDQTVTVIRCWWMEHGLKGREKKLRKAIIPAAWAEVAEWVQQWKASHRETRGNTRVSLPLNSAGGGAAEHSGERKVSEATRRVLEVAAEHPDWTSRQIADAAGVTRRHASMILLRYRQSDTHSVTPSEPEPQAIEQFPSPLLRGNDTHSVTPRQSMGEQSAGVLRRFETQRERVDITELLAEVRSCFVA